MNDQSNDSLKKQIKKARSKFAAMTATYFVGVFNDNFFRQTALLLAVSTGRLHLQGYAAMVFTLPFILFAAAAGYLADHFAKHTIIITSKILELVAMIFAAAAICTLNWPLLLVTLFIMGFQSTMFGPSLYGSIPELYPAGYVIKANAIVKMISSVAILGGIASAGLVLDRKGTIGTIGMGDFIAASVIVAVALIGVILSFGVPNRPAAASTARFPWAGPINSLMLLIDIRKDRLLWITIISKAFFWFIGSLQILIINPLGLSQLGLTKTMTSVLIVVELIGIAIGSMISPCFAKGKKWYRALLPSALGMGILMILIALVPYIPNPARPTALLITLTSIGILGGIFSVPLASFVQIRPKSERKGTIIATSRFADFLGILFSGTVFAALNKLNISPCNDFAVTGTILVAVAVWLYFALAGKKIND